MATIIIGGKTYVIPEMNFMAIERAWPHVEKATSTIHPMDGVSAALGVFAAGLMEAEDFKQEDFDVSDYEVGTSEAPTFDEHVHRGVHLFLKKGLKGTEMDKVRVTMFEVLKEAGLEVSEGEQPALAAAVLGQEDPNQLNLSPGTAADTLPNSLPQDAKEDPGTS